MTRAELNADDVIKVIHQMHGNLAAVAKAMDISRQKMHMYVNDHPSVKAALDEVRESTKDQVEHVLFQKALEGEPWAVCFFLKCRAKERGYVERSEQVISGGDTLTLVTRVIHAKAES